MKIYISASWKKRLLVRELTERLRSNGHEVFDFTDPKCRKTHEVPPEIFSEKFDPSKHIYSKFINRTEWRDVVFENREAIEWAELIILILPYGIDATADWALGVGLGKKTIIVGHPERGESSETHLWADVFLDDIDEIIPYIERLS